MKSFEAITMEKTDGPLHTRLRNWKCWGADISNCRGVLGQPMGVAHLFAAALSSYLEAHRHRLVDRGALMVAAPTRNPVVANALQLARDSGWFSPPLITVSCLADEAIGQRFSSKEARGLVGSENWAVPEGISGQDIVLLDDILTTGATLFGYAAALRKAGALTVRGVVIERITSGYLLEEALIAERRRGTARWHPSQSVVSEG